MYIHMKPPKHRLLTHAYTTCVLVRLGADQLAADASPSNSYRPSTAQSVVNALMTPLPPSFSPSTPQTVSADLSAPRAVSVGRPVTVWQGDNDDRNPSVMGFSCPTPEVVYTGENLATQVTPMRSATLGGGRGREGGTRDWHVACNI